MNNTKKMGIGLILALSILWTPSTTFSYTVLWDTSHGVFVSPSYPDDGYQPSGYYQELVNHLGSNGFTVETTSEGFTSENLAAHDVAVVCVGSAADSAYTAQEVTYLTEFVAAGGGLLIMGDQQRLRLNENVQPVASAFDITLGVSELFAGALLVTDLATHSTFDGVSEVYMYAPGELSASEPASEIAWDADKKAVIASALYGEGRVVALGDINLWSWVAEGEQNFYQADNPQFSVSTFTYLAVPEPASILLLAAGGLIAARKRRAAQRGL
jgi:hypothetical protein